jgi:hypothetical protein
MLRLSSSLAFLTAEITELRQARRQVGQDIGYLGLSIPQLASLPALDSLLPIHRDLARAEKLRRQINAGTLPDLRVPEGEATERLQTLARELDELDLSGAKVSTSPYGWTADATRIVRANEDRDSWRHLNAYSLKLNICWQRPAISVYARSAFLPTHWTTKSY